VKAGLVAGVNESNIYILSRVRELGFEMSEESEEKREEEVEEEELFESSVDQFLGESFTSEVEGEETTSVRITSSVSALTLMTEVSDLLIKGLEGSIPFNEVVNKIKELRSRASVKKQVKSVKTKTVEKTVKKKEKEEKKVKSTKKKEKKGSSSKT